MTPILLLLGVAIGVHLGIRFAVEEAGPDIREEYQRIDRQDEYWECLQSMLAEVATWANEHDPADWWKYGDAAP